MKKWLILFILADFAFVGLVLQLSTENQRRIASQNGSNYDNLTEGQKAKYDLVQSLGFNSDANSLVLKTDHLQSICENSSLIELKFSAENVAIAGSNPTIKSIFSCETIKQNQSQSELTIELEKFKSMHSVKSLDVNPGNQITSFQVYSDEDFPTAWRLSEILVQGESNFVINSAELDQVHTDHRFEFDLTTSAK